MTALDRTQSNAPATGSGSPSKIIKVASGKGGVGKTFFSATLAHCLAFEGENVLLFDGDLGLANIDVQLGVTPPHDLSGVVAGTVPLDEAAVRVAQTGGPEGRGGFDVIPGSSGCGTLGNLSRTELARLRQGLMLLGTHYDRVVVDLAAGLDPAVTMFAAMAGPTLVVVTEEPTSLTDAYAFVKVMTMGAGGDGAAVPDIRIVVNQVETPEAGRKTYETLSRACANFLGVKPPLAGVVPRDPAVPAAIRHQTPLLARSPKAPAGAAIARIAAGFARGKAETGAR